MRLDETIKRVRENDVAFKVTVNGKKIHMCSDEELEVIKLLESLNVQTTDRRVKSAIYWLIKQIKIGVVPICPKR